MYIIMGNRCRAVSIWNATKRRQVIRMFRSTLLKLSIWQEIHKIYSEFAFYLKYIDRHIFATSRQQDLFEHQ